MTLKALLHKKDSFNTNVRACDIMTDRFSAKFLADYKNESSKASYPEVDGHNVLGVLSGIFFIPNGKSVNERFYPKEFWEEVLANPEVQSRMEDRIMFGTIGHEDKYVDDDDLAKGKVSHIVTKLWIDEKTNMGMGEALILGTDAGKNLYMLLKAGAKIKISSRAYGDYVQGQLHEGMPIMDAKTYRLEGFDVVLCPGFPETRLSVHESSNKNNKLIIESVVKRRQKDMSENKKAKKTAKKSESSLTSELRRSRAKAESQNVVYEKKIKELQDKLESAEKELDVWKKEGEKLLKSYKKYNAFGTISDLSSKMEKLSKFEEISEDPEEIKTAIVEATDRINKGKEMMSAINEADEALGQTHSAVGQYLELFGPIPQARRNKIKMERALKQYTSFGTISEIQALYEKSKANERKLKEVKLERNCTKYAALTGQSKDTVKKVFESSKSEQDAIDILKSMKIQKKDESIPRRRFRRPSIIENKNNKVLGYKSEAKEVNADIEVSKTILKSMLK